MSEYILNYVGAVRQGFEKFIQVLPVLTNQKINDLAADRLNSSRGAFLGAVKVNMSDYVLVIDLDKDDWLANAVETGADPFSMKEGLLRSSKAKYGKADKYGVSWKYVRVPIGKKKDGEGGGTDKSKALQQKINQVMLQPAFGPRRLKQQTDGSVFESQRILTSDPDLKGLYRVRKFDNSKDVHNTNKRPKYGLVMFRTVSERPGSAEWKHPGIAPANILKDTEKWLNTNAEQMLDTFIGTEVEKIKAPT